ncbi:phytoene desaturase family protein [Amorphoplanes digitatis]|uniref:Pyridine nucleotide-disulfide oxidoreductase domain-containing protein 2 n=1 Tax=Actinoplanes digitatis TaxID=1868 RepID=A0A7W7HUP0_9ACTN|nr:NAD(P)/FAD-dependent oxidoreductase [Actinoplanes digitatis]MBB4761158.1 phytoene dehydrogenase-like protein [Actinoplanes digitatis]BFE69522.1 NAD(P)/FAD-dependent oxidoreductase [Actinoplanes digitatis]GID92774.1 FAD-dependent oxidoreductase [Actinoplanes digitatis]
MEAVDAIVIGAGHNGLVAANLLADAGWSVEVVEATPQAGGAVRSGHVTAPGYLSDLFSSFYPLGYASPVLKALDLREHGLEWTHAPDVFTHLLPDGRAATVSRDLETTMASMERFAAGDGERWRHAYEEWRAVSPQLLEALFRPFPPVRAGLDLARRLRAGGSLRLARRLMLSVRDLGSELFRGEGATLALAGCALHTDLSPEDAGGGVYGWLLAMLGQEVGWPVPVGGAQQITSALVRRLSERGGRITYGTPVTRVLVARGRAMGVRTADGRARRARRAVLADVPAPALYLDLVGARWLPPRVVQDLEFFRWDGATVKVDWAVNGRIPWRNPAAAGSGTVHLGADLNGLTRYAAHLATGEPPPDPFLLMGQMTTADGSRSPAGTESAWAYTHLPHRRHWTADEIAARVARMEAVMEEYAPGFGAMVVGRNVFSPAGLERENPSLVGGALGGGTAAAFQQLFLRPIPGLGRADTPVERLFLASASAHPGGGVHGVPGANAARAALARDRALTGRLYQAAVGAAHRAVYR